MNIWRAWIISLLVITLSVTAVASINVFHCIDSNQSSTEQSEDASDEHCSDADSLEATNDTSPTPECPCDCSDTLGCLNAGVFTLSTHQLTIDITAFLHAANKTEQFISFYSIPLIRPPIFLS